METKIEPNSNNLNNNLNSNLNQLQQQPQKKRLLPGIIFFLISIGILGVVLYLVFRFYFIPLQVKDKAVYLKELFSNYTKAVEKIIDYMNEDSNSGDLSADSLKRASEKGKLLIKDYQDAADKLKKELKKVNLKETKAFVDEIDNYLKKAEDLYKLTQGSVDWGEAFYPVYNDYEKAAIEIQGVSNYIYYDPDKYISILNDFLDKDKKIIENIKKLKTNSDFNEINELMVEKLQIEYDFLEEIVSAVDKREINRLADAEKEYSRKTLEANKKLGVEIEKINDKIKELSREIKSTSTKVDEEYSQLRNQYRF